MQSDIENEMPPRTRWTSAANNTGIASKGKGKAVENSPPCTPTPGSAGTGRAKKGRAATRETFLDDITPVDFNLRNGAEERTRESKYRDSHDLSLSPRQITRDSLVDNMLLSLDQFSFGLGGAPHPTDDEMQLYSSFAENDSHEDLGHTTPRGSGPGHHYSYSSDYDNSEDISRYSSPYSRGRRSNSSSGFQTGLGRINSMRNDPIAGTAPVQLQPAPGFLHSRNRKGSRGSSTSSLDLTYTRDTATKKWPKRRSSSFDHGQERERNFRLPNIAVPSFSPFEYDAAPTPTVPVGPRRVPPMSPIYPPKSAHEAQHKLERKRSTKSAHTTLQKSDAELYRGLNDRNRELPPLPAFIKDNAPGPVVGYGKSKETVNETTPGSTPQTKERPGFFRKFFGGSSRNNAAIAGELPSSQCSTTSVETADRPRSKPQHIANQMKTRVPTPETPPQARQTLTKKPSSFFRRRKKSEVEPPMPPPTVPPLNLQVAKQNWSPLQAQPSPVSSLRQVMNPYLATPKSLNFMHHPNLDHEVAKPNELSNGLSFEDEVNKKATIRTIPASQELGTEISDRPSTRIPSEQARKDFGATFLRDDSSENDRELQSSISKPNASKDGSQEKRLNDPDTLSSPAVARDTALKAEYEKIHSKTSRIASAEVSTTPAMAKVHTDASGPRLAGKDEEWIVFSKDKPRHEKDERIVLSPTSSEEDLSSDVRRSSDRTVLPDATRASPRASGSTITDYKSATSVPFSQVEDTINAAIIPTISSPDDGSFLPGDHTEQNPTLLIEGERVRAKQIYDGSEDFIQQSKAAAWLGGEGPVKNRTLTAYMELYDFANLNILAGLRMLCGRLVLRAESQQVDRILVAFAKRWCDCNPNHGFKLADTVHTICYSIILLNTDLHMADIEQKMTRSQFVKNTMSTIRQDLARNAPDAFETNRPSILPNKTQAFESDTPTSAATSSNEHLPLAVEIERPSWRSSFKPQARVNGEGHLPTPLDYETPADDCGPLVKAPFYGTLRTWEVQLEIVLKDFYGSIRSERLPLFGGASVEKPQSQQQSQSTLSVFTNGVLRRSPSVLSKAPSEIPRDRARTAETARLGTGKWSAKNRSRTRLYANSAMSSSRTSLEDQSSMWSPSVASSTWTKYSLGKTQTSMSVDSYGSNWGQGDYQQSIGFANALSQAIIREETIGSAGSEELRVAPLLEDESLELAGAPWAKEGIVKHKHHLESLERKAKDRSWNETFAVIEKGYMSLFSFTSKSIRKQAKGKPVSGAGSVVGGGNWQENAESRGSFLLRQTIASALPHPGYSKTRPHVWALSLPTGAVHLFQVGTPDIVREFVSTANYWSARLSNHPLVGGISNIEYGWSDAVINNSLVSAINETTRPPSTHSHSHSRRPSVQSSLRNSIDYSGVGVRAKLPGDKIHISDWTPPTQSMRASNLMEQDQLNTLVAYVKGIEDELQKHNQLRSPMLLAFTPRHLNHQKAMANWEKKSSYLLREIVKFRTYIDSLNTADAYKQRIYAERAADKALAETPEEDEEAKHLEGDTAVRA